LLGQQRVGKDARSDRPGFPSLSEVVLTLRPLDDLAGVLIEVKARATPKERRRDRHCDQFDSPGACDRFHPGLRDSRFEAMFGIEAAMVKASAKPRRPAQAWGLTARRQLPAAPHLTTPREAGT
jgi:hypothetical protein